MKEEDLELRDTLFYGEDDDVDTFRKNLKKLMIKYSVFKVDAALTPKKIEVEK